MKKVFRSGEVKKILRKNKKIFNYITKASGRSMTNLHEVFRMYQNLRSKVTHCKQHWLPSFINIFSCCFLGILKYENSVMGKKNISRTSPHYCFLSVSVWKLQHHSEKTKWRLVFMNETNNKTILTFLDACIRVRWLFAFTDFFQVTCYRSLSWRLSRKSMVHSPHLDEKYISTLVMKTMSWKY